MRASEHTKNRQKRQGKSDGDDSYMMGVYDNGGVYATDLFFLVTQGETLPNGESAFRYSGRQRS